MASVNKVILLGNLGRDPETRYTTGGDAVVVTRRAGQRRFVDLHMHMPASWTLRRAAALRASVEQALMQAVPGLRARIELLPSDVEAHFNDREEPA